MTKADIIDNIYYKIGLTKKDIGKIVDDVFDRIRESILEDDNVKISGFGNFEVKIRGRRVGRNPKTGEETIIKPRKALIFKPSKTLKEEVNGK